jgi:hypothetical protein
LPHQVSIDGLEVRGVQVNNAESFVGDSDHFGLAAEIAA